MIYLVQSALDIAAEHVDGGGLCPESPKVLARVNEAVRRLMQAGDYNHTIDQVRYFTQNNSITLAREHLAARMVNICGSPVDIQGRTYDFMKGGPGEYSWDQCAKLIDQGMHPVFFDPPKDYVTYLFAASTHQDDAQLRISFRGRSANGSELLTGSGSPVQSMPIDSWNVGAEGTLSHTITKMSDDPVPTITSLTLPQGRKGYVSLYALEKETGRMWFLGKYHPSETTPGYRRYRLPVFCKDDGMQVHCLCKKQFIPATSGDDVLLIQNPDAVKMMVMAIEAENNRDLNGSVAMKQLALSDLAAQDSNENRGISFTFQVEYDTTEGINIV